MHNYVPFCAFRFNLQNTVSENFLLQIWQLSLPNDGNLLGSICQDLTAR